MMRNESYDEGQGSWQETGLMMRDEVHDGK